MIKTALISVSNKEGIVDFAKQLSGLGIKIISTGNTAKLLKQNKLKSNPIKDSVAAVSVALVDGDFFVDPDYSEDIRADLDLNVVMTSSGTLLEVQGTAEKKSFTREQLNSMLDAAYPHGAPERTDHVRAA